MRTIMVVQASDLMALIGRITVDGTVDIDALYAGVQRLDKTQVSEPTVFDHADAKYGEGASGWLPAGRWDGYPGGKETQIARVE